MKTTNTTANSTANLISDIKSAAATTPREHLSREEIISDMLPLPADRCFMPETTLEKLICYADKFFSKSGDMAEKPLPRVMVAMARFGPEPFARFKELHRRLGT